MSDAFLSLYEKERLLLKNEGTFSQRISSPRKKKLLLMIIIGFISLIPIFCFKNSLERSLSQDPLTQASRVERTIFNQYDCKYGVAMGADTKNTQGILALIHSIIFNYRPSHDGDNLCLFVFTTRDDHEDRKQSIECAQESMTRLGRNSANVKIIYRVIDKANWVPRIHGKHEEDVPGMEYKWFRYYLTPDDVDGLTRVLYLDTDMIIEGNLVELFEWNMNGHVVAASSYGEPLRNHLCHNHKLSDIAMKTNKIGIFGKKTVTPFETPSHIDTGLLLIDLEKKKKQSILNKWSTLLDLHEFDECLWLEEYSGEADFTLAIRGDIEQIPDEWNMGNLGTPEKYRVAGGCKGAKAMHWNGNAKPYTSEGRTSALCPEYFDRYDIVPILLKENPECYSFQY